MSGADWMSLPQARLRCVWLLSFWECRSCFVYDLLWPVVSQVRVDIQSGFGLFVPCEILNSLNINSLKERIGNVRMSKQMRHHIKIDCVLKLATLCFCSLRCFHGMSFLLRLHIYNNIYNISFFQPCAGQRAPRACVLGLLSMGHQ